MEWKGTNMIYTHGTDIGRANISIHGCHRRVPCTYAGLAWSAILQAADSFIIPSCTCHSKL